jgi:phosphoribosyl 1,2-cyclic phosphodiesterase
MTNSGLLNVTFRGVRGSIPAPARNVMRYGGNTSCVEIRFGHQLLILDAGTGLRALGDELTREFGSSAIAADLLISHTHWDHIQGLPFFAPLYSPKNRIRILAANGRGDLVEHGLKNQMSPTNFPVGLDQMQGLAGITELTSQQMRLENFWISTIELNHPGGCSGFKIEGPSGTVAYLPDHEPYAIGVNADVDLRQKLLVGFVRGVDLLILDTQYTDAEYQSKIGWGHGHSSASVELAMEAEVQRLALFHHDPAHLDEEIDQMIDVARRQAVATALFVHAATENETITLGAAVPSAVNASQTQLRIAVG